MASTRPPAAPTTPPLTLVTPRDRDVLLALDRCPLTVRQLLKLSETFAYPFTGERRVQERLARLCAAGWARQWCYATAGRGALGYYTLSRHGYRVLYGHDAPLPHRGVFSPVGTARQCHTRCLADFVVHTLAGAWRCGVAVAGFYRENALRLEVGGDCLYPDGAFTLVRPDGSPFQFFVELDNVTERLRSAVSLDSWERKVRFYDACQDLALPERFHVLAVTTGTDQRLGHMLDAARGCLRNPHRSLVYGVTLAHYLAQEEPLIAPCFRDNCGRSVVLVLPPRELREPREPPERLTPALASSADLARAGAV